MLRFGKLPSVNNIRAQRRLGLGMRTGVAKARPAGWYHESFEGPFVGYKDVRVG